jgi:transposase InsO family protein
MKPYYDISGVSKQAHQQYMAKLTDKADRTSYYIGLMEQARSLHPVIGLAKIYHLYQPTGIGRTAFENLGKMAGYALEARPTLTWKGVRVIPYQNLLSDKRFTGVNQIWVTDITYYKIGDTYYYISMIMDLYCRKIIACRASDSLQAKHSLQVLNAALKTRVVDPNQELIHHSDRGVQYTSNEYVKLLKKHQIDISMCNSVFENTSMERLNGIIKNDYLIHWNPKSFNHLKRLLAKAVENYNNCPHGQLQMMSPNQYERQLKNVPLNQRTSMTVFTVKKSKVLADPNQLQLFDSNLSVNQKGQPNLV